MSDADTVWLRDPLPYLQRVPADLLGMQDSGCVGLHPRHAREQSTMENLRNPHLLLSI